MPDIREQAQGIARSVTQHPVEKYLRRDLGDGLSFEKWDGDVRVCWSMFQAIQRADLALVPDAVVEALVAKIESLSQAMDLLLSFNVVEAGNTRERRGSLIGGLRNGVRDSFEVVAQVLAYGAVLSDAMAARREAIEREATVAEARVDEVINNANAMLKATSLTCQQIIASAQRAAEKSAVVAHAAFFSDQAAHHDRMSTGWLKMTGVSAAALGAVVIWVLASAPAVTGGDHGVLVQLVLRRLLAVSAVGWLVVWSARNYRAHQHNKIVNTHRTVALRTFEALAKAVGDDQHARKTILLKASDAIFGHVPTAFMPGGSDEVPSAAPLVEVMKVGEAAAK